MKEQNIRSRAEECRGSRDSSVAVAGHEECHPCAHGEPQIPGQRHCDGGQSSCWPWPGDLPWSKRALDMKQWRKGPCLGFHARTRCLQRGSTTLLPEADGRYMGIGQNLELEGPPCRDRPVDWYCVPKKCILVPWPTAIWDRDAFDGLMVLYFDLFWCSRSSQNALSTTLFLGRQDCYEHPFRGNAKWNQQEVDHVLCAVGKSVHVV